MKICRRLIAMGLAASLLSLFGCTQNADKFKPTEGAEIMSLGISESQMNRLYTYSFYIYEENNNVYFSADKMNEDGEQINFENRIVEKEEMDTIRKIAKEINFVEYIKEYKKPKIKVFALDAPSYSCSVIMSDGSHKTIDSLCDGNSELKSFFIKIAEKYDNTGSSEITPSE